MSWHALGDLPEKVRNDIAAQGTSFDNGTEGWSCGCLSGSGLDGNPMVWFCQYHQGYCDGIAEEERR